MAEINKTINLIAFALIAKYSNMQTLQKGLLGQCHRSLKGGGGEGGAAPPLFWRMAFVA